MADYSDLTDDKFQEILDEIVSEYTSCQIVNTVPGVWNIVAEHFHNEVLDRYAAETGQLEDEDETD